jgi:hypothetical protein
MALGVAAGFSPITPGRYSPCTPMTLPTETAAPTTAPPTTMAPETTMPPETVAPETTMVPETVAPETTMVPETIAPETTMVPETTMAPETTMVPGPETTMIPGTAVPETTAFTTMPSETDTFTNTGTRSSFAIPAGTKITVSMGGRANVFPGLTVPAGACLWTYIFQSDGAITFSFSASVTTARLMDGNMITVSALGIPGANSIPPEVSVLSQSNNSGPAFWTLTY